MSEDIHEEIDVVGLDTPGADNGPEEESESPPGIVSLDDSDESQMRTWMSFSDATDDSPFYHWDQSIVPEHEIKIDTNEVKSDATKSQSKTTHDKNIKDNNKGKKSKKINDKAVKGSSKTDSNITQSQKKKTTEKKKVSKSRFQNLVLMNNYLVHELQGTTAKKLDQKHGEC